MPIVRVAIDVPLPSLLDYAVTAEINVDPGQRVIVPFRGKQMIGVVMECTESTDVPQERVKAIIEVLHDSMPLSPELLSLLRFCSDYYRFPIGQTVLPALPGRLRSPKPLIISPVTWYRLGPRGTDLDLVSFPKRKVVQRRILAKLKEQPCNLSQLRSLAPSAGSQIKLLVQQGWVETYSGEGPSTAKVRTTGDVMSHVFNDAHRLTDEQRAAVSAITESAGYACFVLHGITGSGKTEVYVHAINQALQSGGQVLLLVPEINLTPQLEGYFRSRFPDVTLVSLHSGLSEMERLHNWQTAQCGVAQIVLGTRLAVFAEIPRLSLIIVDEEHDTSFKQQDGLRYSARDVAIFRAKQQGIPVVLGSATPSLESYHNVKRGRYRLLKLTGRAFHHARLPTIRCIDINHAAMHHALAEELLREIATRIDRKEQCLVFINRRGYAPVLMCTTCGWLSDCKNCAGKMVLHLKDQRLRCHHCGLQVRMPQVCPGCGTAALQPVGHGTQRVESVLRERFPEARILRVDRDTTRSKRAWQAMREQIRSNEVDIIIGTQMLAKGHDFPSLTLVGVLNPDNALYSSDFRGPERLYAQLAQVAGRAGRAEKPGEVLIQTAFPEHPLFLSLQKHDFEGWASSLLAERKAAGFPPFAYQAMLRAEGKSEAAVYDYLNNARVAAIALKCPVEIFSVVPAALSRRANHQRAQLLIQSTSRKELQQFLHAWQDSLDKLAVQKLRCSLDIDPLEF